MPMPLDWDKLRIFHAAAEAGSFTHAADKLHLSQSAISRQVSALEQDVGVKLFHRHARGFERAPPCGVGIGAGHIAEHGNLDDVVRDALRLRARGAACGHGQSQRGHFHGLVSGFIESV